MSLENDISLIIRERDEMDLCNAELRAEVNRLEYVAVCDEKIGHCCVP